MTIHVTALSTGCCPADLRAVWTVESKLAGTDWRTLISCAEAALSRLRVLHLAETSS